MRTILLVALFLVNLSAIPRSTAEPSPVGRWLMNQPMSLWDWGMFEASRNAERIAEYAERSIGKVAYGHAGYDWKSNEIEMRMIVSDYHAETSHENCNKVRRTFIGQVAGTWSLRDENHVRTSLRSKIDTWFSHRGYQNETRDKELGQEDVPYCLRENRSIEQEREHRVPRADHGVRCTLEPQEIT